MSADRQQIIDKMHALQPCEGSPDVICAYLYLSQRDLIVAALQAAEAAERQEPVAWRCVSPPCKCDESNFMKCAYAQIYAKPSDAAAEKIVAAAKAFVPFWRDGWDEYDEPEDTQAARDAGDALAAAVEELNAGAADEKAG